MDAAYLDHMKRRREAIVAKMAVALEKSGRTFADVDLVGFDPEALRRELPELRALCGIHIAGLMTMAPRGDKQRARACFAGLRELRDELASSDTSLDLRELSCGMSEDFEVALEEGSTIVRLGRVLFDPGFAVK